MPSSPPDSTPPARRAPSATTAGKKPPPGEEPDQTSNAHDNTSPSPAERERVRKVLPYWVHPD